MKRIAPWVLSIIFICSSVFPLCNAAADNAPLVTSPSSVTFEQADTYAGYIAQHSSRYPEKPIEIDVGSFTGFDGDVTCADDYENSGKQVLLTGETGYVEWSLSLDSDSSGFYNILIDYFPTAGKSNTISRSLRINEKIPFAEARNFQFKRIWTNYTGDNVRTSDQNSNDIKPMQIEAPMWQSIFLHDSSGMTGGALSFWFEEGENTLRLEAVAEPMAIRSITLCREENPQRYEDYTADFSDKSDTSANSPSIVIQGEDALYKSDPMMAPLSDRSSGATQPNDPARLRLNCIGGTNWNQSGQWMTWKFEVTESGWYTIGLRYLQNTTAGAASCRTFRIDDELLFNGMKDVIFPFGDRWQMKILGETEPFRFYLEKGWHTLTAEASLGELRELLTDAAGLLKGLNDAYRQILMLTGPQPDLSRDYQFNLAIPQTLKQMEEYKLRAANLYKKLNARTDIDGADTRILFQLETQIEQMLKSNDVIAEKFSSFGSNINALGAWIYSARNQPLIVDYIEFVPAELGVAEIEANWLSDLWFQIKCFVSSFFVDYSYISSGDKAKHAVIWVGSGATGGRDQAQALKTLADNYFTPQSGISADIQLVSMGALLPATLAGKGPDAALSLSSTDAANYAFRGAAANLAQLPGFSEVSPRFAPSAIEPLTFGDMTFGLPETQSFPMLFYRKDILSELGIDIPKTWDAVLNTVHVLKKKQLDFGLPTAGTANSTITLFSMLLFQNGGALYSPNGAQALLDSDEAYSAFSFMTSLYREHKMPVQIDFINRFRMGAMPIGIADYTVFNQMSVFAPELEGLWGFTSVPGTLQSDGTVNCTVPSAVTASLLLTKAKNPENAWEFLKWWTSEEIQVLFGRQLESLMGPAARYATANEAALYQIPWSHENYKALTSQREHSKGIPEVPGGYFTSRNLDFAFRSAVFQGEDMDRSLRKAVKDINAEILRKREELQID